MVTNEPQGASIDKGNGWTQIAANALIALMLSVATLYSWSEQENRHEAETPAVATLYSWSEQENRHEAETPGEIVTTVEAQGETRPGG